MREDRPGVVVGDTVVETAAVVRPILVKNAKEEPRKGTRAYSFDPHHQTTSDHLPLHTLLTDVKGWKNPEEHASQVGCKVADPATKVYVPGGHLV